MGFIQPNKKLRQDVQEAGDTSPEGEALPKPAPRVIVRKHANGTNTIHWIGEAETASHHDPHLDGILARLEAEREEARVAREGSHG